MKKHLMQILGMMGFGLTKPSLFGPVVPKEHHRSAEPEPLEKVGKDVKARPSNDGWVPLSEYNMEWEAAIIDTRDFHVTPWRAVNSHDLAKIVPLKARRHTQAYFHTVMELSAVLDHLFKESGGEGSWRMLTLEGHFRTLNWQLKYIRIYRYPEGYLVCNQEDFVFSKKDLYLPVNKQYLHHMKYKE